MGFAWRTGRVANSHDNIHWFPLFFKGMMKNPSLLTNHERKYNPDFERRSTTLLNPDCAVERIS
jgi:hypothetical protein